MAFDKVAYKKQYYQDHKKEMDKYHEKYRKIHKKRIAERNLKKYYNLTPEQYEKMLIKQNNKCAICNKHLSKLKQRLCVDHDHKTGKICGLLCRKCNVGLGNFDDDINLFNKAIKYLNNDRYRIT